ncbi:MAG: hypothetical protein HY238_09660 [Acidobacteria bacterium]|nr:hypothetical protein [Acidobacteriota bacterium]
MIHTDEQMQAAQQAVLNLKKVLLEARRVHSPQDYRRLAEPILLELQRREQEILEYLTKTVAETPVG